MMFEEGGVSMYWWARLSGKERHVIKLKAKSMRHDQWWPMTNLQLQVKTKLQLNFDGTYYLFTSLSL